MLRERSKGNVKDAIPSFIIGGPLSNFLVTEEMSFGAFGSYGM